MYKDDDILSRHDRAAEELLRQMAEQGCGRVGGSSYPSEPFLRGGYGEDTPHSWGLVDYPLAMVYSPVQSWQNVYCVEEGFMTGTIFRELDKPFYGPRCHGGNCQ